MKVHCNYIILICLCAIIACKDTAKNEKTTVTNNEGQPVLSTYVSFQDMLVYKDTQLPIKQQQIEGQEVEIKSVISNVRINPDVMDSNVLGQVKQGAKATILYKIVSEKRDWLFAAIDSKNIIFKKEKPDTESKIGIWLSNKTIKTDKIISMTEEELHTIKEVLKEQVIQYHKRSDKIQKFYEYEEEASKEDPEFVYADNDEGFHYELNTFSEIDLIPSMLVNNERYRKANYRIINRDVFLEKLQEMFHIDCSKILNQKKRYEYWIGIDPSFSRKAEGQKSIVLTKSIIPSTQVLEPKYGAYINIKNTYINSFLSFMSLINEDLNDPNFEDSKGLDYNDFLSLIDNLTLDDLTIDAVENIEILRNKYFFNDDKSLLPELLIDDYQFLSKLVSVAGYTGDKKLVKGVLTSSSRDFPISDCIFSAHWLPTPHINEEMINLIVELEDRDLNNGLPFSSSIYESVYHILKYSSDKDSDSQYQKIAVLLNTMWRIEKAIVNDTELTAPAHRIADILMDNPELLEKLKEENYYNQGLLKAYIEEEYPKALLMFEEER